MQNEEMLRAYKKLESRYEWAKAQLMELMKATKFDEDLVAQSKPGCLTLGLSLSTNM